MKADEERAFLDLLAAIQRGPKTFDNWPDWEERQERRGVILHYRVALRIDGVLGRGVSLHLVTPKGAWESDLYGQIEVPRPDRNTLLRIDPIEWRPSRSHTNGGNAPAEHRFATHQDRMHPFSLNRRLGLTALEQHATGIAVAFPRAIAAFEDYLTLCADTWNCPDAKDIPRRHG
jgi:hypothetical protein